MTAFLSKFMAGSVIFAALFSSTAHADFVNIDWKEAGDNRAVVDTETGIEWLKLTETLGQTISDVVAKTSAGEEFDGWRIATQSEVAEMMVNMEVMTAQDISEGGLYGRSFRTNYENYIYPDRERDPNIQKWRSVFGTHEPSRLGYNTAYSSLSYGRYYNTAGGIVEAGYDYYYTNPISSQDGKRYHRGQARNAVSANDTAAAHDGVFLVNDGGVTLSSIQDPSINANNPNAPTSVSVGGGVSALILMLGAARLRRRRV